MLRYWFLIVVTFATYASPLAAAERARQAARETLACRLGDEDRHARIAVVLVGGKTSEFSYYSKWADTGHITTVKLSEDKGDVLIEHKKGVYRFEFKNIDRERYCGMDGQINGYLIIKKGSDQCELAGIMEEGTKLGEANRRPGDEDPAPASASASGATGSTTDTDQATAEAQIPAPKAAY